MTNINLCSAVKPAAFIFHKILIQLTSDLLMQTNYPEGELLLLF